MIMLTIAPYIVEKYTRSLMAMMFWSGLLNIAFTLCGLWLAFRFNLTSGATIILVAGAVFLIDFLYQFIASRSRWNKVQEMEKEKIRNHV